MLGGVLVLGLVVNYVCCCDMFVECVLLVGVVVLVMVVVFLLVIMVIGSI